MEYRKSALSKAVKRNIKRKEEYLGRTCRKIWDFTNSNGEKYLFGSFCANRDRLVVIIAYYEPKIHAFYPAY